MTPLRLPAKPIEAFRKQKLLKKDVEVRRSKRIDTLKMKQEMAKIMDAWIKTGKIGNYEKKMDKKMESSSKAAEITTTAGDKSQYSLRCGSSSIKSCRVK